MKAILVFPPQWSPLGPHFSLASLYSQLVNNGHEVNIRDLNIEFYDEILKKGHLVTCLDNSLKSFDKLFKELAEEHNKYKKSNNYPETFKKKLAKYTKLQEIKEKRLKEFESVIDFIDEAVSIMRDKDKFYDPQLLIKALNTIDVALEITSSPFYPSYMHLNDYNSPFFKLTFESIKEHCLDRKTNMFYEFYERIIPGLLAENPDFIAISINSSSQIVPGLTLAMLLKAKKKCHVNIGGNFWGRIVESLLECPEFFELFADSITVEEGEKPIIEFARYIEGKLKIDDVPNLMFSENGVVKITPKTVPFTLNEIYPPNLEDFPLHLYLSPDIVLSVQSSKGCYWKKCSFCDQDFGQNFSIKDVDKFANELKYLKTKFNISHFEFIDESVSPIYLESLSKKLSEEDIDVNWFINARLEKEFTPELLKQARDVGLRMMLWGFESGSNRVMRLINKGIDIDKRLEILKTAIDNDIWNFAYIFFGFPSETKEEGLETIKIISENTDLISSYGRSIFTLGKHTKLRENPEKFSITKILENSEEFSPSYQFETSVGMNSKEISEMAHLCTQKCNEAYNHPLWMYLRYREVLFLYICKYGADVVRNTNIK